MEQHIEIINDIKDIFAKMSKGNVSDKNMTNIIRRYEYLLKQMDDVYRGIRKVQITNEGIIKTKMYVYKSMLLLRELHLSTIFIKKIIAPRASFSRLA